MTQDHLKQNERKIVTNPFLEGWVNPNEVDKVPAIKSYGMESANRPHRENERKVVFTNSILKKWIAPIKANKVPEIRSTRMKRVVDHLKKVKEKISQFHF